MEVTLDAPDSLPDLPKESELALFRALQESLSKVTRHGAVEEVDVELYGRPGQGRSGREGLMLVVRDAGRGFDPATLASNEGLGLAGIREQAEVLGGTFSLTSAPGEGTEVRVWWPVGDGGLRDG